MDKKERNILMSLDDIMGDRFGRYSKYIIQDRALPDVRDGLKPVQRRILYAMYKEGNTSNKPYRKSAKTVGNVIGNYHPHGDSSVYDAMVRLSQDWKMRIPLIDMQGNNGSIDNDPAAAMRYTEARLSKIADELLKDLDKDTVLMTLNFDDTEYEPTVLPARYPNLLVNGATGISAGYATDIPPHNLEEVIDATIHRLRYPHCSFDKLVEFIKGPDFPTGAIVEGKEDIYKALKTGRGKVIVRSKYEILEKKNMNQIHITEIPYEVNKADLVRKIDEIRFNKSIDGIIEVRDESDRNGLSIVIDIKKDIDTTNTLNYLFKTTDLQKNYNYNMTAIKDKRPVLMGIDDIIDGYIHHSKDVIIRRTKYNLNKAMQRQHIVDGLIKAISILDEVVHTIRQSKDKKDAKVNLQIKYGFTEAQSEAIVMLQLYRLTNTDILVLEEEKEELLKNIQFYESILSDEKVLIKVIVDQLREIKKNYPTPRLTEIKDEVRDISINEQAMILQEDCYVSVTRDGYIKRISMRSYNASVSTPFGKKENDRIIGIYKTDTLSTLLVFTDKGKYCFIPVYKLEDVKWKDVPKHLSYLVKISNDEKIIDALIVNDFDTNNYIVTATSDGQVKKTELSAFKVTRYSRPLTAMNVKKNESMVSVSITDGNQGLLLVSKEGFGIAFSEAEIPVQGLKASGVKGQRLVNDQLAFMRSFDPTVNQSIVLISLPAGIKRIHFDLEINKRALKGTRLFKNTKTNPSEIVNGHVFHINDEITIIDEEKNVLTIPVKSINYSSYDSRMSKIKELTGEITDIDFHKPLALLNTKKVKKTVKKVEEKPEEKVEETLFDLKEIEVKEEKKPYKPKKKKSTKFNNDHTKLYENLTLEDLLNNDDF